ncbi:MAG: hypothetical protein HY788_04350 [Deltaproteobacteria bacterium]|nr:hypothetical protein [Deltaproteobacteria bacterium]
MDGPKTCIFNHECSHCAFDQWLDYMDEFIDQSDLKTGESTRAPSLELQAA